MRPSDGGTASAGARPLRQCVQAAVQAVIARLPFLR